MGLGTNLLNFSWHKLAIGSAVAMTLTACGAQEIAAEKPSASATAIQAHLEFLASDEMAGRDTGSRGHEIASQYIATEFKRLGLEPAGDDGTYYQRIQFRKSFLKERSAGLSIHRGDETIELDYPKQFIMGPSSVTERDELTAPLVFVGYGMVSETFGIDDYAGLDVDGKIVVMLTGRPEELPSEEAAHLSSIKGELAAERGAVGILTVHTPQREEVRSYETSMLYLNVPTVRWLNDAGEPHSRYDTIAATAYVDDAAAEALFANSQMTLADIFTQLENNESPKGFAMDVSATLKRESRHEQVSSPNVAAVLPGSDPELRDEYLVYTAHSDHIGVSKDLSGDDNINNGAMDNAAGVSVMLETARMFVESEQKPQRSVMFLAVTAEERGLLGADYFAHNPTVPMANIVANVNLDMPVLLYDFADVIAFGANHSTLGDTVAAAAAEYDIELSPDPMPEQAIFTRSDHYTLVKKGVPAVFLMTGFTSKNPDEDGGKVWGEFFAKHYHRPSDEPSLPIRYESGALFTDINFAIGQRIANDEQRPQWLSDSFFGKVFGQGDSVATAN
ncbi:Zn-dependent amino- or carboxypeptidase, M28 family [Pseudidiomarina planktonica]|uniref:Zn-dependent amino- or carboxypeptidase, M28 family n=1 Tax=Pseudidiomarina planktonica TaxID=1323738 RepID=A0A1Y6ERL8_9GAMM|nr:M28 family metallopeptidase [Pseudidiomarina planktonica]RUO65738.1 peptidase M28 [Pseudidiomarina planktonica]SMQ63152.1 Zn-dependent amino- or carboxypeptidase, M28 family [Pseudidiomarina planktonica]